MAGQSLTVESSIESFHANILIRSAAEHAAQLARISGPLSSRTALSWSCQVITCSNIGRIYSVGIDLFTSITRPSLPARRRACHS